MDFVDERLSTKWYCMPPTIPVLLDSQVHTIDQVSGQELAIQVGFWDVTRAIHMDGRRHPPPSKMFYQGHSIGWYEGDELIIETTNFTFDTDGMDDHLHIPSSFMKKVTERYRRTSQDTVSLTVTQEDPLFLRRPYTWTQELTLVPRPNADRSSCVQQSNLRELELTAPDPYRGQ